MSPNNLCQAVAPEEAAEHDAGLLLVPVKVGAEGDGADGHGDTGTVQQARPQQQHHRPHTGLGPAGMERKVGKGQREDAVPGGSVHSEDLGVGFALQAKPVLIK